MRERKREKTSEGEEEGVRESKRGEDVSCELEGNPDLLCIQYKNWMVANAQE